MAKVQAIGPRAADAALKSPARMAGLPGAVQSTAEHTATTVEKAAKIVEPLKQTLAALRQLNG